MSAQLSRLRYQALLRLAAYHARRRDGVRGWSAEFSDPDGHQFSLYQSE